MADRMEELDADNVEAWRVFHQVACRLAVDVPGLATAIMAKVVEEKEPQDAAELLERMSLIYDTLYPPKQSS